MKKSQKDLTDQPRTTLLDKYRNVANKLDVLPADQFIADQWDCDEVTPARMRSKLKAEGYPSYTEKLGDKIRVRAGPFPNKAAADKAAARIQKVLGVSASVAAKS